MTTYPKSSCKFGLELLQEIDTGEFEFMQRIGDASSMHFQDQRFLLLVAILTYLLYLFIFSPYAHQINHRNLPMLLMFKFPMLYYSALKSVSLLSHFIDYFIGIVFVFSLSFLNFFFGFQSSSDLLVLIRSMILFKSQISFLNYNFHMVRYPCKIEIFWCVIKIINYWTIDLSKQFI